jgi:hypothetical protein
VVAPARTQTQRGQQAHGSAWQLMRTLTRAAPRKHTHTLAARHLHARVRLVHELKQLVDDGLEELPVLPQELGVLAHHVPAGGRRGQARVCSACMGRSVAALPAAATGVSQAAMRAPSQAQRTHATGACGGPPHART